MTDFLDLPQQLEPLVNLVFLLATGAVALHGLRFRDEDGNSDWVRLLFACIAAVFFFAVLFQDVLGVVQIF